MKSFLDRVNDPTVTWTSDDDVSISSSVSSDYDDDDESISSRESANRRAIEREDAVEEDALQEEQEPPGEAAIDLEQDGQLFLNDAVPVGVQEQQHNNQENDDLLHENPEPENHDRENIPELPAPLPGPEIRVNNGTLLENLSSHERSNELLFRIARSEELPLIRAEIDWKLLLSQLSSYPGAQIGDPTAAFLLQSILRMDPPLEIIKELIKIYPKSCVDMDPFYAACQYASDGAVQLLMKETMVARISEGIPWSMLALLGDARIRVRHARFLLKHTPEVVTQNSHGVFGVSPLDRMISGAFIHGDVEEWTKKLKLALLTADRGFLDESGKPFYPFHALLRRLVSSGFRGIKFGALSFLNCLSACINGESDHLPFHQIDEDGNLPIHVVLGHKCETNLETIGERKLVKFLLTANVPSAMTPNAAGVMPIRLAIENGWPVYDIFVHYCDVDYVTAGISLDDKSSIDVKKRNLLIHDILNGPFHPRFGISGARTLIRFILNKFPSLAEVPDANGCYPIHLAIENGWPCHDLIIGAAPSTLEMKNKYGFYPYQIASYEKCSTTPLVQDERVRLSILFEIIREGPLLLEDRFEDGAMRSDRTGKGAKRKSRPCSDGAGQKSSEKKLKGNIL